MTLFIKKKKEKKEMVLLHSMIKYIFPKRKETKVLLKEILGLKLKEIIGGTTKKDKSTVY